MSVSLTGTRACGCTTDHTQRLVVVTGGPGAGKTALLEVARRQFCAHVAVLPEAATIVYGGGFPRLDSTVGRRRAQIAILHVQDQMERIELEQDHAALVLCDRGLLDGLAYWPGDERSYLAQLGATRAEILARYAAVIHMRPPSAAKGYDLGHGLRIESAEEAAAIDARIERAYAGHPERHVVESEDGFVDKLAKAMTLVTRYVPTCCR